jgi:hypothetical protein
VQDEGKEEQLKRWLHEGRENKVIRWICSHQFPDREDRRKELITYLENNRDSLNGVRGIPTGVGSSHLRRVGSGVVEKTIGVLIADRFKGHGRLWSIEGASNLLALCVAHYNSRYPLKGERKIQTSIL